MRTTMCMSMIAATNFVASGLAFVPETHQIYRNDPLLEMELEINRALEDRSIVVAEDEQRRENDEFFNQIETMSELDENILINEVIETDQNDNLSQYSISMSGSLYGHNTFDKLLADEFDRKEVESYFANDLLRNDEIFYEISQTTHNGVKISETSQRRNLRRRT